MSSTPLDGCLLTVSQELLLPVVATPCPGHDVVPYAAAVEQHAVSPTVSTSRSSSIGHVSPIVSPRSMTALTPPSCTMVGLGESEDTPNTGVGQAATPNGRLSTKLRTVSHPCSTFHRNPCRYGDQCRFRSYPANSCCWALQGKTCKKVGCTAEHSLDKIFRCATCGESVDHTDPVAVRRFERYHDCKDPMAKHRTHPCTLIYFVEVQRPTGTPAKKGYCWNRGGSENQCHWSNFPVNACLDTIKYGECRERNCPAEHDWTKIFTCPTCGDEFLVGDFGLSVELMKEHRCPNRSVAL